MVQKPFNEMQQPVNEMQQSTTVVQLATMVLSDVVCYYGATYYCGTTCYGTV